MATVALTISDSEHLRIVGSYQEAIASGKALDIRLFHPDYTMLKPRLDIRIFDILSCLLLLTLFALPMMVIAILIALESRGGILYKQKRVGLGGKPFTILKFRSMHLQQKFGYQIKDDARITRVGKFLRLLRLDELPQLFNVLQGSMSLVGPRPEQVDLAQNIEMVIPEFCMRTLVKPGITGWAQVWFRYGSTVEDSKIKLAYDLYWIKNGSFLKMIQVTVMTVAVMLTRKGAK